VFWGYSGYFYQQMPDPAGLLNVQDGCWVTVAIVINKCQIPRVGLLVSVLSLLRFPASDYLFGIFLIKECYDTMTLLNV
jgi:hypothetical protein